MARPENRENWTDSDWETYCLELERERDRKIYEVNEQICINAGLELHRDLLLNAVLKKSKTSSTELSTDDAIDSSENTNPPYM